MKQRINIPCAPSLIESMRSIGYSFESALADIIDNSISAKANDIQIISRADKERKYLQIVDNGVGMDNNELFLAMRYGSRNPNEERSEDDLGRFGLGMKSASLSQCRRFTVVSKKNNVISTYQWDIDNILLTNDWSINEYTSDELDFIPNLDILDNHQSGTIVLWENFDRIKLSSLKFDRNFNELVVKAEDHIALIYHRLLDRNLRIFVNGNRVKPLDPFIKNNPATQIFREQKIYVNDVPISVNKYVLPSISKLKESEIIAAGGKENLRKNQGFYIYRNKRLIIWGTWFRLHSKEELFKLARVMVDIPNSLDDIWDIDIKKSRATIPDIIKDKLIKAVEDTVSASEYTHVYKGRKIVEKSFDNSWNLQETSKGVKLFIDVDRPMITKFVESLDKDQYKAFEKIIGGIESDIPYDAIYSNIAKGNNFNEKATPDNRIDARIEDAVSTLMELWGMTKNEAIDAYIATLTDSGREEFIQKLRGMRE